MCVVVGVCVCVCMCVSVCVWVCVCEGVCVSVCVCVCVWCVSHSQKNVDEVSLEMKLEGKWSLITASFISLQITQEQLNTTHTNTSHFKSAWLSIPASRINLVFPTNPNPTSPLPDEWPQFWL